MINITKEYLQEHYWNQGKSIDELAQELKCGKATVFRRLKKYWPTWRGKSEAQQLFLAKNNHQRKGKKNGRKDSGQY